MTLCLVNSSGDILTPRIHGSSCSSEAVQVNLLPDCTCRTKTQAYLFKTEPWNFFRNKADYCVFDKHTP